MFTRHQTVTIHHLVTLRDVVIPEGRTYLAGEGVILVGDQQDGGKKRQKDHFCTFYGYNIRFFVSYILCSLLYSN